MPSHHESFWNARSFAVVGHAAKARFPVLTYRGLRKSKRVVYPVDCDTGTIDGDRVYPDFASLPQPVEAVVIEVPREETRDWVERAANAGIRDVWIHMMRETPEAVALASARGLSVRTGTCAVMYVTPGLSYHCVHKWIQQLRGKY
jgi:predicted CoA-binding protein